MLWCGIVGMLIGFFSGYVVGVKEIMKILDTHEKPDAAEDWWKRGEKPFGDPF